MSRLRLPFRVLAIGDRSQATPEAVELLAAAGGGAVAVLLRDLRLGPDEVRVWAEALLPVCRAHGARLLVHRRAEIAARTGADGVHLPDDGRAPFAERMALGPAALVGLSRHDAAGLGATEGADYATLSPIFATPGKGAPLGLGALERACAAAPLPVLALGGITPARARRCAAVGAAGVAAIRAVWEGDPAANVRALLGD